MPLGLLKSAKNRGQRSMASTEAKSEKVAMIESASSQRLLPTSPEAENALSMFYQEWLTLFELWSLKLIPTFLVHFVDLVNFINFRSIRSIFFVSNFCTLSNFRISSNFRNASNFFQITDFLYFVEFSYYVDFFESGAKRL